MLATTRWRGTHRTIGLVAGALAALWVVVVGPVGGGTAAQARTFCGWQANHPGTTGPWGFTVTPGVEAMPTQLLVRTTPGTPPALSAAVDHAVATMNATAGVAWRRGPEVAPSAGVSTADRRGRPPPGELWVVGSPQRYRGLPPGTYTSTIVERLRGGPAMPMATLVVLADALGGPGVSRQRLLAAVVHEFGHAAGLDHHFAPWGGVCQAMSYAGGSRYGAGDAFGLRWLASRAPATRLWGDPFGNVDVARTEVGGLRLAGWAIDPDTTGPVAIHLYVNGRFARTTTASLTRPDVGRAYPFWGTSRGFDTTVSTGAGDRAQVCAYAINVGVGTTNPLLGCVTAPSRNPFGNLDLAQRSGAVLRLAGWAIDPDTTGPVGIHVYVNGRFARATTASVNRPDVGRAHRLWGAGHGFDVSVPIPGGGAQVCAFAINVGPGTTNPRMGCALVPP